MRELKPCGTIAAYRRHVYHGETPCDACWLAQRDAHQKRRERIRSGDHKPEPRGPIQPCGTMGGYQRHRKRLEPTCLPCRKAKAAYDRDRYRERLRDERHGTVAGWRKHRKSGEIPCERCTEARRREIAPCGTPEAFDRHFFANERPCGECRALLWRPLGASA